MTLGEWWYWWRTEDMRNSEKSSFQSRGADWGMDRLEKLRQVVSRDGSSWPVEKETMIANNNELM